jgi:hypothetical protein
MKTFVGSLIQISLRTLGLPTLHQPHEQALARVGVVMYVTAPRRVEVCASQDPVPFIGGTFIVE